MVEKKKKSESITDDDELKALYVALESAEENVERLEEHRKRDRQGAKPRRKILRRKAR